MRIEQTCSLPDDAEPIFEFRYVLDFGPDPDAFWVDIKCRRPPIETIRVALMELRPAELALRFESGYNLAGTLQVQRWASGGGESVGVWAKLSYDWRGQYPREHFQGFMFDVPLRHMPVPPAPPRPYVPPGPDGGDRLPIVRPQADALFPFVYVRRWPQIPAEDLAFGFFGYPGSSPPATGFVADLAAAKLQGRVQMEALAIAFIDGDGPYAGLYVPDLRSLEGPVSEFAQVALAIRRPERWTEGWRERLCRDLNLLLAGDGGAAYLRSAPYRTALDRIWQSYFALVVLLGYDQALVEQFTLALWAADAADQGLAVDKDRLRVDESVTPYQSALLAEASIRLPADIFPMPPAAPPTPPAGSSASGGGWVEPYAVGDLQLIRQRLVRYAAGEIARIENVMRGERREVSSRRGRQQFELQQATGEDRQLLESDDSDARTNLIEEVRRTIAQTSVTDSYDNFTSSYGPPTQATLSGSRTRATNSVAPGVDDVAGFARDIISKSVNRLARRVETVRASGSVSEAEDIVSSIVDNSSGAGNLCAVYRWVDKIYEACVVNYGNRLIMEFILVAPPVHRHRRRDRPDPDTRLVPPPSALGLDSFRDVSPDIDAKPSYATLCAEYGVTEIVPPPSPARSVTASLRAGDEVQVALPAGYCAVKAGAGWISTPPGLAPPAVLVGSQSVVPGADPVELTVAAESESLAVAAADLAATSSPPPEGQVAVAIECAPTDRCIDEWRIAIYGAIVKAYEQRIAERRAALIALQTPGAPQASVSPLARRDFERLALKRGCTRLLLEDAARLVGVGPDDFGRSPPSPAEVDLPRYQRFLDEALEWSEMSYTLGRGLDDMGGAAEQHRPPDPADGAGAGEGRARVLLPVRPERALAFLYFLASGMIWDGPDGLVAVNDADLHIVDDLKRALRRREPERRVGEPWPVVVPTGMQILDSADRLEQPFRLSPEEGIEP